MDLTSNFKCCNCGEPYNAQRDDVGRIVGFVGSTGTVVTKCISCREILQPTKIQDAKKIKDNGKMPVAIIRMKSNVQNNEDPDSLLSLGLFYLTSNDYIDAISTFDKVIAYNPECANAYFYYSIALLGGKKPFTHVRDTINQVFQRMEAAIALAADDDDKLSQYYCFMAYITYDYFERKYFTPAVSSKEWLYKSNVCGLTVDDSNSLFDILNVQKPVGF